MVLTQCKYKVRFRSANMIQQIERVLNAIFWSKHQQPSVSYTLFTDVLDIEVGILLTDRASAKFSGQGRNERGSKNRDDDHK